MIDDAEPLAFLWSRSAAAVLRTLPDALALAEIPAGLVVPGLGLANANSTLRERMADDPQLRPALEGLANDPASPTGTRDGASAAEPTLVRDDRITTEARAYRVLEFVYPDARDHHLLICRLPRAVLPAPAHMRARLGLTLQEARVAIEVAQGLSNRAIARRLNVTERTVRHHVQQVMRKLGSESRTAVAATIWRSYAR